MSQYILKLYVTGKTPSSVLAIRSLRKILKEEMDGRYSLKIIDILKNPRLAEKDKILATPTLIKKLPLPIRKLVGSLSDREKVLIGIDFIREK
ncbi:MAG: circadian clock protein KaiB [Deltaproteobacteria bacterium]|nr:circadian clock protein KaiB [Deltaproteobacteria bacterium]